jgi:hypothetical protein
MLRTIMPKLASSGLRSGLRSAFSSPFQLRSRMTRPTQMPMPATRKVHSQPSSLRTDAANRFATKAPMLMPM